MTGKLKCRKVQDTCREGCKFGCPPQHQTRDPCELERSCIIEGIFSGSLLPIVSMMQATDARE